MAPRSAAGTGGPSSGLGTERLHRLFLLLLLLLLSFPSHCNPAINHPCASQCLHPAGRLLLRARRLPGRAAGRGGSGRGHGSRAGSERGTSRESPARGLEPGMERAWSRQALPCPGRTGWRWSHAGWVTGRALDVCHHRSLVALWERGFLPPHWVSTPTVPSLPLSHGPAKSFLIQRTK